MLQAANWNTVRWILLFCTATVNLAGVVFEGIVQEAELLKLIAASKNKFANIDADELVALIKRGWFSAARELVAVSHEAGSQEHKQAVATVVRRETAALKQNCDSLLQALTVQKEVGLVNCAFQWSQNSSCLFLSIKFSHRWSSPGALELQNNNITVTDCCLNFSADGEHSGLKKRYALNLEFFDEVDRKHWSWQLASAGRLTVLVPKRLPNAWPRLLKSSATVKNMASWTELSEKWAAELKLFKKVEKILSKSGLQSFGLEPHDFTAIDQDADGRASRYEIVEYAEPITSILYKSRHSFPFIKDWDDDKDGQVNSSEWRYNSSDWRQKKGPWSLEDSKFLVVKQMLLTQHKLSDTDKDKYVTFDDLRKGGWTYEENSTADDGGEGNGIGSDSMVGVDNE